VHVELITERPRESLPAALSAMAARPDVQLVLLLGCDADGHTPESADAALRACPKPIVGGVFPQLLHGVDRLESGLVVAGLRRPARVATVRALSSIGPNELADTVEPTAEGGAQGDTVVAFADGLSSGLAGLVDGLFDVHGLGVYYVGGGAGSLSLKPSACVFTRDGLLADAAVVARLAVQAGLGVRHGWQPISDAYRVTESRRNVIETLDWRPALDVYREVLDRHGGGPLDGSDFFEVAKAFPFGIERVGGELVVRDPIARDGHRLVCVGEVPQGAFVRILHGRPEALVEAAAAARHDAQQALPPGAGVRCAFVIDCISRVLFLGERFGDELRAIARPGERTIGALTLGEIANRGRSCLEFHNKTAVVALLAD
jgi:hypothetical protein